MDILKHFITTSLKTTLKHKEYFMDLKPAIFSDRHKIFLGFRHNFHRFINRHIMHLYFYNLSR